MRSAQDRGGINLGTSQWRWDTVGRHGEGEMILGEFYVDLDALQDAASGINTTLDAMATKKVSDIDAPKDAFGHDELATAVLDFCDRWNIGVENLAKDGAEVSDRLNQCVKRYQAAEVANQTNLNRAIQNEGS